MSETSSGNLEGYGPNKKINICKLNEGGYQLSNLIPLYLNFFMYVFQTGLFDLSHSIVDGFKQARKPSKIVSFL
jgi:hypothetical protein